MSGDKDEGGRSAASLKPVRQLDPGHAAELNIEDEAIELRMFGIGEKCLSRRVGDGLKAGGAEEAANGLAHHFIIVDNGDVSLFAADHREVMFIVGRSVKRPLLSFGGGGSILSKNFRFQCEASELCYRRNT